MVSVTLMDCHHLPLLVLLLCFFINPARSIRCSEVKKKREQKQPEYTQILEVGNLDRFTKHEQSSDQITLNKDIPVVCDEATRVALFNTNNLQDTEHKVDITDALRADVQSLNPTIAVFQMLPTNRPGLEATLGTLGYEHFLGNDSMLIASRIPISQLPLPDVKIQMLAATFRAEDRDMTLVSLRMRSVQSTNPPIPDEASTGHLLVFPTKNTLPIPSDTKLGTLKSPLKEISILLKYTPINNVFVMLSVETPKYTSWTGAITESISSTPDFVDRLCGAYSYHSVTTGHVPLVVDFGDCQYSLPTPWVLLGILGGVIVVFVASFLYFRSLKRPQGIV